MASSYQKEKALNILEQRDSYSPEGFVSRVQALTGTTLYPVIKFDPTQTTKAFNVLIALLVVSDQLPKQVKETKKKEEKEPGTEIAVRSEEIINTDLEGVIVPDYYEVLGVDKDATSEEIKKAHRKLVKEFHPDTLGPDATTEDLAQSNIIMQEINTAYAIVGNKGNKEDYDKIIESKSIQIESTNTYGSSGSVMVFYDSESSETSKPQNKKSRIPTGFFDQSRIMRLQNGSVEKNLAIAMMLSKNKVSNERLEGIVSLLVRWGKLSGKPIIPDRLNEQLGLVNQNLGLLNNQQKIDKGINPDSQISSVALIQSDGTVLVARHGAQEDQEVTQYTSIDVVPEFIRKQNSVTIDVNREMEMSLSDSNFSFRNNPIFQKFQDKAGDFLKKKAIKELEKAGIKFAGKEAAKLIGKTALKTTLRGVVHGLAESLNAIIPGLGVLASAILEVAMKLVGKALGFIKRHTKDLAKLGAVIAFIGVAGGSALMAGIGGLAMLPHVVSVGPGVAIGGALGATAAAFAALAAAVVIAVGSAVIVGGVGLVIFVSLVLFIINNSAFVTPQGNTLTGGYTESPGPGDGTASRCQPDQIDISSSLAGRIRNGRVRFLPESIRSRSPEGRYCIDPTMIVMHWSAGANDDPSGNDRTYNTLIQRGLSCQLGTDTNDTELWQPFYENTVEMPQCVGEWNTVSINNEMAGVYFTGNPPPPNLDELELTYDATCKIMEQYDIPWCQIFGHFEAPNNGGKPDPGEDFLYNVFIPEIKNRCPNDSSNVCN